MKYVVIDEPYDKKNEKPISGTIFVSEEYDELEKANEDARFQYSVLTKSEAKQRHIYVMTTVDYINSTWDTVRGGFDNNRTWKPAFCLCVYSNTETIFTDMITELNKITVSGANEREAIVATLRAFEDVCIDMYGSVETNLNKITFYDGEDFKKLGFINVISANSIA